MFTIARSHQPNGVTITNRLKAFLVHVPFYSFEGQFRIAHDCGVSCSTISRLIRHQTNPSYRLARAITDVLARRLGVPLDMRDVFSTDGTYPTPCVCDLIPDCHGCFPDEAYDSEGNMQPEYRDLRPGDWCRFPPLITLPDEQSSSSVISSL